MQRARDSVLAFLLFTLVGCGDTALPPKAPPAPKIAAPEVQAPDLTPVEEPKTLLAVARWKSPTKGIDRALALAGVPLSVESKLLSESPEIASLLKLDASLDLAISLDPTSKDKDPKVLVAISIPLTSFERARALSEKESPGEEVQPGVVRFTPKTPHGESVDPSQKATQFGDKGGRCDIAMSVGDAPARLVCADSARDLDALRGWMTRGLPRTPAGPDDLNASFRFQPIQDRYRAELKKQAEEGRTEARAWLTKEGVSDADLLEAPSVLFDEGLKFFEDVDAIDFRTALVSKPPEFIAGATLRFHSDSSWLTRAVTFASDHPQAAPAMFWRVPKDASSAYWGQSQDPARFDGIRNIVRKATVELLGRGPSLPAEKAAILAFLDGVPRTSGVWVSAQGLPGSHKKPPHKAGRTPAELIADAKAYGMSAVGWNLTGVHEPAAKYVTWAKLGLDLYQRGVHYAHEKATKPDERDALAFLPTVTTLTSPPGYPKGSVAFDIRLVYDSDLAAILLSEKKEETKTDVGGPVGIVKKTQVAKKKAPAPKGYFTVRLVIVPDGDDTWIGFSANLPVLQKLINAAVTGAPASGTIASRDGLEALRGTGSSWAGFYSFGDVLDTLVDTLKREVPKEASAVDAVFASMPNKANTPILWLGSGARGKAPSSSVEMRLEQGTLTDIAAVAAFLASDRGRELLKSP